MTLRWKIAQYFELRWWKNYLQGKDKLQYLEWKKNYWKDILAKISEQVKIKPSTTIADLGCGPAGIFIALPQNKITAVDPLLDQYEQQTSFFKKSDYPNVCFVTTTIEDFCAADPHASEAPLPDSQAETVLSWRAKSNHDLVFCMNAINHVHDIEKGFNKLREICKENGAIVVSIDAHNFSFFKHLFRLLPGDILHPHQCDLNEYKSMLEKDGWMVSKTLQLKHEFFFDHFLLVGKRNLYR